jgi:hypothetical protein
MVVVSQFVYILVNIRNYDYIAVSTYQVRFDKLVLIEMRHDQSIRWLLSTIQYDERASKRVISFCLQQL